MKTREELNALKEEYENLNRKLAELTEDELGHIVGGAGAGHNNGVILVNGTALRPDLDNPVSESESGSRTNAKWIG